MPSRFENRFQSVAVPSFEREFGVLVRFVRGVNVSDEFTARRNDRKHKAMNGDGDIELGISMRDFILPVASVVIDGDVIEPRTGDRIVEGGETFEIQPPDGQKRSVELQSGGFEYLVHTKRVE